MKSRQAERLAKQKLLEITSSPDLFAVSKILLLFNSACFPNKQELQEIISFIKNVLLLRWLNKKNMCRKQTKIWDRDLGQLCCKMTTGDY